MILAGIYDYLFPWQLLIFGGYVAAWLIAGPYLTRRGLRRIGMRERHATLGRSSQVNFLAQSAGLVAMLAVTGFFVVWAVKWGPRSLALLGGLLGLSAMFFVSLLVQSVMLDLSGRELLRAGGPSAGAATLLWAAVLAAAFVPARMIRRTTVVTGHCQRNLSDIYDALNQYRLRHEGRGAPSLQALLDEKLVEKESELRCPAGSGQEAMYRYVPDAKLQPGLGRGALSNALVAWDSRPHHGGSRMVLFADGRTGLLTEADFRALLAEPENAAAAKVEAGGS